MLKGNISLNRRRFYALISFLIILNILVPIGTYWSIQKTNTLTRWNEQINYAQLFREHTDDAASLINGTSFSWNNQSKSFAQIEINYAYSDLLYITSLDLSHFTQLNLIGEKIRVLPSIFDRINNTQRMAISTHLHSLGDKIVFAYYLNYPDYYYAGQPNIWYFGPSPPDEGDLRDASTIAANLTG